MDKWVQDLGESRKDESGRKIDKYHELRKEKKPIHPTKIPQALLSIPDITSIALTWFDQRGDIQFNAEDAGQIRTRGGFEYYKPSKGIGFGLNLGPKLDLFDKWAVAFHGVRDNKNIVPILRENLRPGAGQAYRNQKDIAHEKTVPNGVYFSPHLETTMGYVNQGDITVLQCLINPQAINITSRKDYWVVQKNSDIVPYRIIKYPKGKYQIY